MESHSPTEEKSFLCSHCGKFAHQSHLKEHEGQDPLQELSIVISEPEYEPLRENEGTNMGLIFPQELSGTFSGYECDICHSHFASSEVLERHRRCHPHMVPNRRYKCSFCTYSTDRSGALAKHMKRHSNRKPHKCVFCKKGFKRKSSLYRHLRCHTGEKPFECDTCGKGFDRRTSLLEHERRHTGDKPYLCPDCGKGFAGNTDVKKHRRIHMAPK